MRSFGISAARIMAASHLFCGLSTMISTLFSGDRKSRFQHSDSIMQTTAFLVPRFMVSGINYSTERNLLAFPVAETATMLIALVIMHIGIATKISYNMFLRRRNDERYFCERKPVLLLILSMTLPMVLSMLVNFLYNIIDSFFRRADQREAMTALSLVYPVQNFINAVGIGFVESTQ